MDIPVLSLAADALGTACGDLQARLKTIRETGKPASQDFIYAPWTTLTLKLKLRREEAQVPNVVAVLPGRDPKLRKEYIVLGAHLDHLGLGERHSLGGAEARGQVHPGADDNASGTAMVVELARELKQARPRRSILLLHFGGEEEGLLGSSYWIQHPTHPLEAVKFMLNFDMVGRLDPVAPKLMMGGLGAPKAALEAAKKLAPEGFAISVDVGAAVGGSDHMSFSQAKIPTFFFFTGIHGEYHRPTDTADRINYAGHGEAGHLRPDRGAGPGQRGHAAGLRSGDRQGGHAGRRRPHARGLRHPAGLRGQPEGLPHQRGDPGVHGRGHRAPGGRHHHPGSATGP